MSNLGWLFGSVLWVTGVALLLTVYSYRDSRAASSGVPAFTPGGISVSEWVLTGQFLVCTGFLFTSQGWLEQTGWTMLVFFVLLRARARWGRKDVL